MKTWRVVSLCALALMLLGVPASAQNETFATASWIGINQPRVNYWLSAGTPERWYQFRPVVGRSYCVEVGRAPGDNAWFDPTVTLYQSDGTTQYGYDDDGNEEPYLYRGSRFCFISTLSQIWIKVADLGGPSATHYYEMTVVETTQWSPYWQVATSAGYDAAPQVRNNTNQTISVTFTAYNASGGTVCSNTFTLNANAMRTFGVSGAAPGCGITSGFGSAQIAHTGAPGAIAANITTFSGVSGLSFDAPFTPRQDYAH